MCTGADKVGAFDGRMTSLLSKCEDIEEIVGDAEYGSMGEIELFLPYHSAKV